MKNPKSLAGLFVCLMTLVALLSACNSSSSSTSDALLHYLQYVPDTEEYRAWFSYGNTAAWYEAWDISRPASPDDILAEANAAARPYILTILPEQTVPPISLQTRNLLSEDQRGFYGFDMLNLDSYAQAGQPPTAITLADFSFDRETIASALSQSGYETTPLGDGTLYQLRGDNELDFQAPLATSQFPNLNRIVLVGNQMVIGSATQVVEQALSAQARDVPSLADNPLYVAAAEALADSSLTEWGTLVGVILIEGPALPQEPPPQLTEALADQFATYAAKPLPDFQLAVFATRQQEQTTYLLLALVLPPGADAQRTAETLAERLQTYVSTMRRDTMNDFWQLETATSLEANDLPIALVVMRTAVKTSTDTPNAAAILSWYDLTETRDTLFLVTNR